MINPDTQIVLTIENWQRTLKLPLTCIIGSSLQLSWERNATRQITFVAYDDNSVGYNLLENENIVQLKGQEYVIKQCIPTYTNGYKTTNITATHISSDVSKFFNYKTNAGTKTYSPDDVMSFYFANNNMGYTYEIIGDFEKRQISDLGNSSGQDCLSKVVSTWETANIVADNKHIKIVSKDEFAKNLGNRIGYMHNSDTITLSTDSTGLVNRVLVSGAKKDDGSDYFKPFICEDQVSIKQYGLSDGGVRSDERFRDRNSADWWGKSQLNPLPAITITATVLTSEEPIAGEVKRLEILEKDFSTDVMIVAYTYYPLDRTQKTTITLNNNAKTILDYQINRGANRDKIINNNQAISNALSDLNTQVSEIAKAGSGWLNYKGG